MAKTKHRTSHRAPALRGNFNTDLAKIKAALAGASFGVKNRTEKLLNQKISEFGGKTTDLQTSLEEYVTDKPIKCLSIAVLTGVALGIWMRK